MFGGRRNSYQPVEPSRSRSGRPICEGERRAPLSDPTTSLRTAPTRRARRAGSSVRAARTPGRCRSRGRGPSRSRRPGRAPPSPGAARRCGPRSRRCPSRAARSRRCGCPPGSRRRGRAPPRRARSAQRSARVGASKIAMTPSPVNSTFWPFQRSMTRADGLVVRVEQLPPGAIAHRVRPGRSSRRCRRRGPSPASDRSPRPPGGSGPAPRSSGTPRRSGSCGTSGSGTYVSRTTPELNGPRVGQAQVVGVDPVAEQALAAAEDDRVDEQPVLVDQVVAQELVDEVRAAVDEEVAAGLRLQLPDLGGHVAGDDRRVVPVGPLERVRDDVLRDAVHLPDHLEVAARRSARTPPRSATSDGRAGARRRPSTWARL